MLLIVALCILLKYINIATCIIPHFGNHLTHAACRISYLHDILNL